MAKITFTVFGGTGFVGSATVAYLERHGANVWVPTREDIASGAVDNRPLGHVIYAIGLTGNFRSRLSDTVEAHVCLLNRLIGTTNWTSWLFLSSTRVYGTGTQRHCPYREGDYVETRPASDSVYDLSKLLGEAICLARTEPSCRVVRLSNVFGPAMPIDNFLGAVSNQASRGEDVLIREAKTSLKDYIPVNEVARILHRVSLEGRDRLYNVASGASISHQRIAELLEEVFGVTVTFAANGESRQMAQIDIQRIRTEFGGEENDTIDEIRTFLETLKSEKA